MKLDFSGQDSFDNQKVYWKERDCAGGIVLKAVPLKGSLVTFLNKIVPTLIFNGFEPSNRLYLGKASMKFS